MLGKINVNFFLTNQELNSVKNAWFKNLWQKKKKDLLTWPKNIETRIRSVELSYIKSDET